MSQSVTPRCLHVAVWSWKVCLQNAEYVRTGEAIATPWFSVRIVCEPCEFQVDLYLVCCMLTSVSLTLPPAAVEISNIRVRIPNVKINACSLLWGNSCTCFISFFPYPTPHLSGTLPPKLGDLDALEKMGLAFNILQGMLSNSPLRSAQI